MKDNKFTFFESYHKALSRLSDGRYGRVIRAVCNYAFHDEEPNFEEDSTEAVAWDLMKPIIDNGIEISKVRSESGSKGGANGKGVSRNVGNKFAAKDESLANNSKTIAKENFANDDSIAPFLKNNSGKDKEEDKEEEMEWEEERITPTPPQLEDVVLYFDEHDKGKASDPNKFFSHFDSLGWVSNGQPIVNWKSRADMWISEDIKKSAGKPPSEPFVLKPPTKEEYAEMEAKRQESEYERFKGLIDLIRREPGNIGREPLNKVLQNGTLDKYPDLKKDAESLFFTTSLQ